MFTDASIGGGTLLKINTKTVEMKIARIKKGYSLRDLAEKINLSNGYLCQIENNQRHPSPKTAKLIHNALGVDFDKIFFIDNACKSEQNIV